MSTSTKVTPQRLSRVRTMCRTGAAKTIRQSAGISLRELGEGVGVSQVTVYRWENARTRPSGPEAMRYLTVLDDLAGVAP